MLGSFCAKKKNLICHLRNAFQKPAKIQVLVSSVILKKMGFWSKPEPPVLHLNVNSACPFLFTEENDLTDVCFPRFGNEAVEERVHERVEDGDSDADLV